MKIRTIFLTFLLIVISFQAVLSQNKLKRRGFAGFGFRGIEQADVDSLNLKDTHGLIVNRIVPDTPAERAGLNVGDIVKKYDDHQITSRSQFISILKNYYANDNISISLIRDGEYLKLNLVLQVFPEEKDESLDIEYTSFETDGVNLRAVISSPLNSKNKKLPAVLLVSALSSPRLIGVAFRSATRELAYDLSKAGFRVLRFELRGFSESEGEDYRTLDFKTESDDNLAALDYLMTRKDVDGSKVFIYGHSTGGMIAAILASKRKTAGVIPSCTMGRTFFERAMETLRVQGEFSGKTPAEIDDMLKDFINLLVPISQGESLSSIIKRLPDLAKFVNENNRIMDDRNIDYWRQQLNLNLPLIYSSIEEPALVIYAASDYLTLLACHEHIKDVMVASDNKDVTLSVIENLDHAYSFANSKKESYQNYHTRNFKTNLEAHKQIIDWLLVQIK